ncbi:RNA-dependent ATPase HCA4 [Ascoidea rubescens DSM 1968]|uniref:ATP-dependent RNA helicase n=1 Tax=Ascoidea rubescens DSM 1968 TaxID=1344418 RepID=A0A1D2VJZ4_9ASCO|nr:DEAD-domain-containing protein [Ascoidea rubescens DSM 1968]ODV61837.1 DEAD-domain-containing protein [Ascoidea rubescens DSM 1968]
MGRKNKNSKQSLSSKKNQRAKEIEYIKNLEAQINDFNPNDSLTISNISQFSQLPISKETLRGLTSAGFVSLTDIQKKSIPVSLKNLDILASARTGSGKTLAFLIPIIEKLYRNQWTEYDGLGALVLSPTRELAMQTYEVLTKIGKYNSFSAGLVMGGKDLKFEKDRIYKMNILIATPGRILQHLDQSAGLDVSNLQILVLDEADRILDMGFKLALDSILNHLPPTRQTLLFSATQTKSITDLARLSLINPQYVDTDNLSNQKPLNLTNENTTTTTNNNNQILSATPQSLEQSYIIAELQDKLNILWSFIKSHLKSKIIVFFSTSKQVHFVYESFRKLQPGISLLKLHGRQKQTSRTETTFKFSNAQYSCLFATDVIARGIDFPSVNWVIQLDCPEDVSTYIHRVGRSARFGKSGKSLLFLLPSESKFIDNLKAKSITTIKQLNIKPSKQKTVQKELQGLCFKNPELKYLAQKCFISYFKSIYTQKDKQVFQFDQLPSQEFAKSLGLSGTPKIKFKNMNENDISKSKQLKNASRNLLKLSKANDDGEILEDKNKKTRTKYDKMFERQNQNVLSEHYLGITSELKDINYEYQDNKDNNENDGNNDSDDDEDDGNLLKIKRIDHKLDDDDNDDLTSFNEINTSKRASKKALSRKASSKNRGNPTKLVFDDDGNSHAIYELEEEEDFHKKGDAMEQKKEFVSKETVHMQRADEEDKIVAKDKRDAKKRRRKELERQALLNENDSKLGAGVQFVLGENSEDENGDEYQDDYEENGSESEEPLSKKPKWFQNNKIGGEINDSENDDGIVEFERPETLEDLEALTAKLM